MYLAKPFKIQSNFKEIFSLYQTTQPYESLHINRRLPIGCKLQTKSSVFIRHHNNFESIRINRRFPMGCKDL